MSTDQRLLTTPEHQCFWRSYQPYWELHRKAVLFSQAVWPLWMPIIKESRWSYLVGRVNQIEVTTGAMIGRVGITLRFATGGPDELYFLALDGEPGHLTLSGVDGRWDMLDCLINQAIESGRDITVHPRKGGTDAVS